MLTVNKIIINIDGSSQGNPGPSGIGVYFESGTKDKLFGSIGKKEILQEIEKKAKLKLGKVEIIGNLPIKKVGDYKLKIKLAPTINPEIILKIAANKKETKKKK